MSELNIVNTQNLSTETIAKIDAQVDAFIAKHKENSVEINRIVFDGTAALVAGDNLAQNMGSHGKLKRFWRRFNGDNGRTQDTINANLIEAQYAAQKMIQKLAEQNLLTFELIAAVNNSLNAQIAQVNAKIIDIKKKLVDFFSVAKIKIKDHEDRIQRLEHESDLNHWATNIRIFEFNGASYQELDDTAKMICIVRDFLRLTGDKRYSVDFDHLKTALINVGLKLKDKISYEKFIRQLSENSELCRHLLGGDFRLFEFATENESILFTLSKINENTGRNFFHVQMNEISNVELAFELFYNLEQVICAKKIAEKIKNAEMHKNLGDTYYKQEKYEQAIQDYSKSIELNPNCFEAYYNRGMSYYKLKQYECAIQDYDKAIELNPNFSEAYYNRGNAYSGLKQDERAIQDYDKAIQINPNYFEAYDNRGFIYLALGQHERAIQDYTKVIELDPNSVHAYKARGMAYSELGKYERAIQDFNKAIELNPNSAVPYKARGMAYSELGKYEQTIQDFNKAIELDPNDRNHFNLGEAYRRLRRYKCAIQNYDKAIEFNPNFALAYNNRGFTYLKLKLYERAIQDFNKAIELNPNDAVVYNNRGGAYSELGNYGRAIQDYDKAIELNPNSANAYVNRGNAYVYLDECELAIQDYDKAIELNPNFSFAYYKRGRVYDDIGDEEKAQADFAKAKELGW